MNSLPPDGPYVVRVHDPTDPRTVGYEASSAFEAALLCAFAAKALSVEFIPERSTLRIVDAKGTIDCLVTWWENVE